MKNLPLILSLFIMENAKKTIKLSASITYNLNIEVIKLMGRIIKENGIEDLSGNLSEKENEIIRKYTGILFQEVWNKIILTEVGNVLYKQNKEIVEDILIINTL